MDPIFIKDNLDQLGETEARNLLSEWIISSTDQASREDALNLFASIDNHRNFNFFEQLFLSDENHEIRFTTGKILTANYSNHDRLVPLLSFTLRKECNIDLKFLAIESLFIIDSKRTKRIIFEFLEDFFRLEHNQITGQVPNNFLDLQDETLTRDILEYCYNLILHDFYVNQCNFYVVMRDGFIILLNVESAGLSRIHQIQGLTRLTHLEHFLLKNNRITTIENIEFLRSLKILNLSSNNITEIKIPKSLIDLEELYLSSNKLKKIKNLQHLRNLRKLYLDHNQINHIENLNNLKKLTVLNLNDNLLKEIHNLNELESLTLLNLSANIIEKISGLQNLRRLTSLYINDNKLTNIANLRGLTRLKVLNLSNNSIVRIENLEDLVNLTKLEISNNRIKKIEGLDHLLELQELFIDGNQIEKFEGLENLENLIILFLDNNKISEFSEERVKNMKCLNFDLLSLRL